MSESLLYSELLRYLSLPLASTSKSRYSCPQAPLWPMQYLRKKSYLSLIYKSRTIYYYTLVRITIPAYYTQNKASRQMSLEEKQDYLRTEIVERGYDAEQFYEFWQTFGIELPNATMDDVVSIVTQFQSKATHRNNHKHNEDADNDNDDEFGEYVEANQHQGGNHDSLFYQDINWDFLAPNSEETAKHKTHQQEASKHKQHKQFSIVPPLDQKQDKKVADKKQQKQKQKGEELLISVESPNLNNVTFQDVIKDSESVKRKCLKLQPNILEHHTNVQIFIPKFKQMTEQSSGIMNKLWKATYLLFTIKTIARNKQKAIGISWEVQRQHSDFQWLRNTLVKMYPGVVVPPLPALVKSQDQLNGYQKKLESFLLDCYNCPELRNSKYFQVFLSYSSSKDFEAFKKGCESTSRPKNLTHILNMEGQLSLLYSDKIEGYAEGLQSFITKTSQHLKNVKTIIKQIDDSYSQISQKYKELSQVFTTMSQQSCQFSDEECYPRLTETYRQISQLVNQHSYFCMLQKEFLETFMFSHFAYERDRVENMQGLITKRKAFAHEFAKPKHQSQAEKPVGESTGTSVFGKIAGLFGEKSESLEIPSSQTSTLRDQVGFYNSQLMRESIRCVEGMVSSHVNHFSTYGHSRIDNVESMQKLWSKLLVELSKLKIC